MVRRSLLIKALVEGTYSQHLGLAQYFHVSLVNCGTSVPRGYRGINVVILVIVQLQVLIARNILSDHVILFFHVHRSGSIVEAVWQVFLQKEEDKSRSVDEYSTEYEEGRTREGDEQRRRNVGGMASRQMDPEHLEHVSINSRWWDCCSRRSLGTKPGTQVEARRGCVNCS